MKKGLLIVNTGDGKGKSTAAFGMVLRAWGRGFRICVIQFIKAETGNWGEIKAAKKLDIEWHTTGDGFTWTSKDMDETIARARHGWELAREKISVEIMTSLCWMNSPIPWFITGSIRTKCWNGCASTALRTCIL